MLPHASQHLPSTTNLKEPLFTPTSQLMRENSSSSPPSLESPTAPKKSMNSDSSYSRTLLSSLDPKIPGVRTSSQLELISLPTGLPPSTRGFLVTSQSVVPKTTPLPLLMSTFPYLQVLIGETKVQLTPLRIRANAALAGHSQLFLALNPATRSLMALCTASLNSNLLIAASTAAAWVATVVMKTKLLNTHKTRVL